MTSDTPSTPTEAAAAAAPAKPPRRRATRKAAAPAPVDTAATTAPQTQPDTEPDTQPAAPEPTPADEQATPTLVVDEQTSAPATQPDEASVGQAAPAATAGEPTPDAPAEAPAPRATRSRRATTAGAAAPKRATRSRAAKAPADDAPQTLDVLAELGRTRPPAPVEQAPADAEPDAEPVEPEAEPVEPDAEATTAEPTAAAAPDQAPDAEDAVGGGPRLATTALLFQPPQPSATRSRSRRVVAPAGPPQFVVPEVVSPARAQPAAEAPDDGGSPDTAEAPADTAPSRRGSRRRATRTTAAPAPVADVEAAPTEQPSDAEAVAEVEAPPAEAAPSRRGSRRRGSRAQPADETTTDADEETTDLAGQPADDAAKPAAAVEATEPDEDDDEDEGSDGAPRRRRRRGGRGRRSRAGGDGDGSRPATDTADGSDEAEADEDEDEDAVGQDADGEDTAGDTGEGEDAGGSSRRRRRRRRSGRGGDAGEADTEAAPAARTRTPRPASDEVTALRGSTRLEAKRQRRREGRDNGRRRQIVTESEFLARRESVDRTMVVREMDGRTQIAVLEDGVLVEHYVSRQAQVSMAGNVYLGRVQNVLPSMEAAFVDVGKGRNAVLYAGEVNWDAAGLEGQPRRIEQALKSGDSVLVQVTKDPIGHKGARLTSQITLAGRYLVYVPGGGMTGISRKLPDNERARLKKLLREIVPDTAGVIVRTAAEGASEDELRADIARLQEQWTAIEKKARTASAPALLQGEPDLAIRVVRDIFNDDFSSLVVEGDEAWQTISGYIGALAPDLADKVSRWTAEGDVFAAHRVDEQLAKGMDRKVWLPSGGSLVIDRTEAMTVVDVNTGKFTGSGGTLEETVTRNNLEAAEEIVRQLRLRDIGGIIVIDFIDMVLELNRDLVLRRLVECLGRDRTKHQVAEVTSLGLVQMTRKRVGQGLVEAFSETCEHCNGRGFIVHTDPIERGGAPQVQVQTPQPPVGGDSARGGARRKRGGTKEQGPALPSGLPMVPVLPEAREAVKATLATIAAAAAHAHEHDGHGHAAATGQTAPATAPVGPSLHPDAAAAVTEALAALRTPELTDGESASRAADEVTAEAPDTQRADAPADAAAYLPTDVELLDVATGAEPTDASTEVELAEVAEVLTDGALRDDEAATEQPAGAEAPADDTQAPADDADAAAADDTLELVPVAPEVFHLGDDEHEGPDGTDGPEGSGDDVDASPEQGGTTPDDASGTTPDDAGETAPADAGGAEPADVDPPHDDADGHHR